MTRPNLNAVAIVEQPYDGAIGSTGFHVLRANNAHPRFIYYATRSPRFVETMSASVQGALYPAVRPDEIRGFILGIPPLNEQRRIVDKLDAIFEKSRAAKARLERLPALLDQLKRSILAAAFRGDLTKDWRAKNPDVEPASVLLERIRAERRRTWEEGLRAKGKDPKKATYEEPASAVFASSPDEWASARLIDLVDPIRGITYGIVQTGEAVTDGVPTVRCGDVKGSEIDRAALKRVHRDIDAAYPRTRLRGGEILVAIRGTVGGVVLAGPELVNCNISREVAMIPTTPGVDALFVKLFLASTAAQQAILASVKGVAQQGINLDDLRNVVVPLPSMGEQAAMIRSAMTSLRAIDALSSRAAAALVAQSSLEQAALAKAFRGELVPQDPTDEPADVLLERLRATTAAAPAAKRSRSPRAAAAPTTTTAPAAGEPLERIVAVLRVQGRASTAAIAAATGLDAAAVKTVLKSLERLGKVAVEGKARGTTWVWQGG